MAVQAVGSTPTSRHPSSYNLGIHRHPASACLDRPHGGAATCICTGASAAGNTEARQVNTQARVESAPSPARRRRHHSEALACAPPPMRLLQRRHPGPTQPRPLASRSGLARRIGSASARPLAGEARQTPTQLNIPRPQPIHPDTHAPGLHHTASRALGGQAMDPRRRHPGRTWARASESVRRTTMNVASLRSHSLKSHPADARNKA